MNNAVIHGSAWLGENVMVWNFATVCEGACIGANTVIGSCAWVGKNCQIGEGVRIQHGAFLPNGTVVEDGAFIGPNVTMTDDKYPRSGNRDYVPQPPVIRKGASIGAGAVILPGVVIGPGAMVAAGAVVTRDVKGNELAVGIPARTSQGAIHATH